MEHVLTIKDAQHAVKAFAERNEWKDVPNIDKIDHLHEELSEISQHIRYKSEAERIAFVKEHKDLFTGEFGDVLFGLCRLANQFGIDLEEAFNQTKDKVLKKYSGNSQENNIPWEKK